MKKFDFLLVLIALGLIGMGYYFAKEFKSEAGTAMDTNSSSQESEASEENSIPGDKQNQRIPSNNGEQKKSRTKEDSPSASFQKQYFDLKNCLVTEDCDFPQDDPRSYEISILQALNSHLADLSTLNAEQSEKILKDAAQISDGHIKKTVLKHLVRMAKHDSSWRDLILNEYVDYFDSKLIPEVMDYLKEFSSESDVAIIHQRLLKAMAHGSPMVANAVASNIKSLLNSDSLDFYKRSLNQMQDGPIKDSLRRELRDFELEASAS